MSDLGCVAGGISCAEEIVKKLSELTEVQKTASFTFSYTLSVQRNTRLARLTGRISTDHWSIGEGGCGCPDDLMKKNVPS